MKDLKKKIILLIVILVFLFFINFFGLASPFKNIFYLITSSLQEFLWQTAGKITNFFEAILSAQKIKSQRDKLLLEKQKLLTEIAFLQSLKEENKSLRKALFLKIQEEFKIIDVKIISIGKNPHFIFINKGKTQGIEVGLPVISPEKVLFGKVTEVYPSRAKVMLISHSQSSFLAKILNKDVSGLIKGQGNNLLSFSGIPKNKEILLGDILITSSLTEFYPENLLVGEISKVKKQEIELFQRILVKPFFNLKKANLLFVILDF
jgi:rod shape-determining protein MreC